MKTKKQNKNKSRKITPREALELLLKQEGSRHALARAFGLSMTSICKWLDKGEIPPRRVLQAYNIAKGKISLHEFRPDIYPK